jgi:hypothetical protein
MNSDAKEAQKKAMQNSVRILSKKSWIGTRAKKILKDVIFHLFEITLCIALFIFATILTNLEYVQNLRTIEWINLFKAFIYFVQVAIPIYIIEVLRILKKNLIVTFSTKVS